MLTFKLFLESEEDKNIKSTLKKIPRHHAKLVDGYTFTFKGGNTLPGDDSHIGYMDRKPKEICIAAPWNYGREFTFLHEIAHLVLDKLVPNELKKKWVEIVKRTNKGEDEALHQSPEELFCMAYAQHYADNKMVKYNYPEWMHFIEQLP